LIELLQAAVQKKISVPLIPITAESGSSNGNGGNITMSSYSTMTVTDLDANAASGGSGYGGTIALSTPTGSGNAMDLVGAVITATGGNGGATGLGGTVSATNTAQFDVNAVITVDGGTAVPATSFDGAISLNGISCRQWKMTYQTGTFPPTFWDCVGTVPPGAQEQIPPNQANGINAVLQSDFTSVYSGLQVYVFANATAYNTFWTDVRTSTSGGFTFDELISGATTKYVYTAPFESGNIEDNSQHTYSPAQYNEVSAHEQGHAIDAVLAGQSFGADFTTYILDDFFDLDYTSLAGLERSACHAFGAVPAPYAGITDLSTGDLFCGAGAGYESYNWTRNQIRHKWSSLVQQ
jgi:hypothetical protein